MPIIGKMKSWLEQKTWSIVQIFFWTLYCLWRKNENLSTGSLCEESSLIDFGFLTDEANMPTIAINDEAIGKSICIFLP